eukprot:3075551-Pleurochrysis_carterae.AAC.1
MLYAAPPGVEGSTNGSRSVDTVKSLNHESAVPVRRASVTSMTLARAAVRSARRLRAAGDDGSPSRHLSASSAPNGPASPRAAALFATPVIPIGRVPSGAAAPSTKARMSARQALCAVAPAVAPCAAALPPAASALVPSVAVCAAAPSVGGVASRVPSAAGLVLDPRVAALSIELHRAPPRAGAHAFPAHLARARRASGRVRRLRAWPLPRPRGRA